MASTPAALSGPVQLFGFLPYPSYRLLILAAGLAAALALYLLVSHTKLGMWVRAGASNRQMAQWMGIRVNRVFAIVFAMGAALAALAGALMAPSAPCRWAWGTHLDSGAGGHCDWRHWLGARRTHCQSARGPC